MKIVFVENRYTTFLWDAIAKQLELNGIEIFWIIQNKEFIPRTGKLFYLNNKVPKNFNVNPDVKNNVDIIKIIKADRGINYYGVKSADHIYYGFDQIKEIIDNIKPDFGVGEATLFHELLVLNELKNRNIPYFFPISCRFPIGRISFYLYDTLWPFGGNGSAITFEVAKNIVTSIAERKTIPHSLINTYSRRPSNFQKVNDKIKIFRGYVKGEKFNTPSIYNKLLLIKKSRSKRKKWDSFSCKTLIEIEGFKILYPLQMQPESTIDVWANGFNNQTQTIKNLLLNTDARVKIIIKPNPTSNQEITKELIELLNDSRIIVVHHLVKMDDVINEVDLVVTTTGTIGLECVFANKPVVTLVESFFNKASNCLYIKSFEELPSIIEMVKENSFPKMDIQSKVDYLNYLNMSSYEGIVACSFTESSVLEKGNVENLKNAFLNVIDQLNKNKKNEIKF